MQAIWKKFSKEEIEQLALNSDNIKDFCIKLGYSASTSHRKEILTQISEYYNIDFSKFPQFIQIKIEHFTREQLEEIFLKSVTFSEVSKKLGYSALNIEKLKEIAFQYQISICHLKNAKNKIELFTREELKNIVDNSSNFTQVAKALGYKDCNGQIQKMIEKYLKEYNITTEHFYKLTDLSGKMMGNYKVLYELTDKPGYWYCECQCENKTAGIFSRKDISNKRRMSCGCTHKTRLIDMTGQHINKLTVLERDSSKGPGEAFWICRCDCGNLVSVRGSAIRGGHTTSCGKCTLSRGEERIKLCLQKLQIKYIQQFQYKEEEDCFNKLRFDFALLNKNNEIIAFIEYQGSQHYIPFEHFGGKQGLLNRQERDLRKRKLAEKYKIPLIEIPYSDYDLIDESYILEKIKLVSKALDNS